MKTPLRCSKVSRVTGVIILSLIFVVVRYCTLAVDIGIHTMGTRQLLKFSILDNDCEDGFDAYGGILVYLVGICYLFIGLSVICETHFHNSLDQIVEKLKLPGDVAGATFMAAGSSSPELFTSLIALFGVSNDMGVGTVVGSAIFNLLVIVGGSGVVSPTLLHLDWRPITRDAIFNVVSFLYLVAVFWDNYVQWYEALIGVLGYITYVLVIAVNQWMLSRMNILANTLSTAFSSLTRSKKRDLAFELDPVTESSDSEFAIAIEESEEKIEELENENGEEDIKNKRRNKGTNNGGEDEEDDDYEQHHVTLKSAGMKEFSHSEIEEDPELNEFTPKRSDAEEYLAPHGKAYADTFTQKMWFQTKKWATKLIDGLKFPYEFVFRWTVPNMKQPRFKYAYLVAFFMCITWIALLSWVMVEFATKAGCIMKFDHAIVGLTLLAVGTSLPDCLASLAVARKGRGNMAVCNALGSNIFDILFCLGFPWMLSCVITGDPVHVKNNDLVKYVVILFVTMLGVLTGFILNKWRLDSKIGIGYCIFYCILVIYFLLEEVVGVPYI